MAEPVSTGTASAAGLTGVMGLLVYWLGPVGADVTMVFLSAICGTIIALSEFQTTFFQALLLIFRGVLTALVLAWALSGAVAAWVPAFDGPYLPSVIALGIGFSANRYQAILGAVRRRVERKVGVEDE